jgi:opacity protein-like surface antigen
VRDLVRSSLALALFAVVFVTAPDAQAFERQWHAGIDGGYAALFDDPSSGFGGGAHLAYGLNDAFNAVLEVDVTRQPSAGTTVWSGGAGVVYTFDVARAVPYGGVLGSGYKLSGDLSKWAPGFQLALGLDYQLERNWGIGIEARWHTIFATDPVGTTAYATTLLKAEYRWGF